MGLLDRWTGRPTVESGVNEITLSDSDRLLGDVDFGEGPRWHDGRWWYCDFYQRAIFSVTEDGKRAVAFRDLPDRPAGLDWTPDGTMLVIFRNNRVVMRDDGDGHLVQHADVKRLLYFGCNDIVVDAQGNAYVTSFGVDSPCLVRRDGSITEANPFRPGSQSLSWPKGMLIVPDGSTLIVSQPLNRELVALAIDDDHTLSGQRQWAKLPGGAFAEGCSMDTDHGVWFANVSTGEVLRIVEGGTITDRVVIPMNAYDCALGGPDGQTLMMLCSPPGDLNSGGPNRGGAIYTTRVAHAAAGR